MITDVAGVAVGHTTVIQGENVRTGVTAILPHAGNLFKEKVPGAIFTGNGFGKLAGSTQVNELGEIETPILLTSTLSVPRVAEGVIEYMLSIPGNEDVRSVNPVVGETNDGWLNDIRGWHISREDVIGAITNATMGSLQEGAVGAGTGTVAFGFKGGIGTSSRRLLEALGGYTVGVLVQSNFGGILTIAGAPIGRELGQYYLKDEIGDSTAAKRPSRKKRGFPGPAAVRGTFGKGAAGSPGQDPAKGSAMIVIATDAPVEFRNLSRMAARAMMGLARTGSSGSNESGDYAIAFSSAVTAGLQFQRTRRVAPRQGFLREVGLVSNDAMSPLFLAVIEATEEAVYNSLFRAKTTTGQNRTVEALPIGRTLEILRSHGVLSRAG